MENRETAVNWLLRMLYSPVCSGFKGGTREIPHDIIQQAKSMEKEQSIKDYKAGAVGELWELNIDESAESYYNKTYANDTTKGLPEENSKRRGWHY